MGALKRGHKGRTVARFTRVCVTVESALTKSIFSLNVPLSPRDAEIMQQKQKKANEGGKEDTKSK